MVKGLRAFFICDKSSELPLTQWTSLVYNNKLLKE